MLRTWVKFETHVGMKVAKVGRWSKLSRKQIMVEVENPKNDQLFVAH